MKSILNFFKSRYFLIGIGILLLVVLIWVLGGMFDVSTDLRFGATILVLVLCIILMALSFARANRYASAIEQSIKMQSEQQMMNVRPDKREEILELKEQLEVAIDALKRSKLGQGRRSKAALYALPWYVFIGPPTSGKTTAILNSGLNFPMGKDRIRGVGGTRNCDWFFSDAAIFLDTAGRYVTEHEDREEWISFLDMLKKNRPEKPINGVLVGISLTDLVGKRLDEVEQHADKIRRRIDELVGQLDIRFPVYIVFTKTDLLRGFIEFFGALDNREREQIWGCTFEKKQSESTDIRTVFEEEFELLAEGLVSRRSDYLSRSQKREGRHNVYVFPLEFAGAKENLTRFVTRVFQPNPYQVTPIFRGFYFTSGTQEGIPIEGVINKLAQSFGLQSNRSAGPQNIGEKKSYFIKDMFTDVVIPDQYLVSQTPGSRMRSRLQKAAFSTGAVVLLGLFILLSSSALLRSKRNLTETGDAVVAAARVDWADRGGAVQNLSSMLALDQRIDDLDGWGDISLIKLDRSRHLIAPAKAVYQEKAREFVQIYPSAIISARIREAIGVRQLDPTEQQQLYRDVKTMLLMSSEAGRLADSDHALYLKHNLTELTEELLQQPLSTSGDASLNEQANRQVDAFVEQLIDDAGSAFPPLESGVLRQAQLRLVESPTFRTVYDRILRSGEAEVLPPISLSDMVGTSYGHLFQGNPEVPGVFTRRGWDAYFKDAIARESQDPGREDWVTGGSATPLLPESDPAELAKRLEELYFQEYERAWRLFLQQIRYAPAADVRSVAAKINELSSTYTSPLLTILERATGETTYLTEAQQLAAAAEQVPGAAGRVADRLLPDEMHPLARSFKWLHDLQARIGMQEGPLVRVFETLGDVSIKLDEIGGDREQAAAYTRAVLTQDGAELEGALFIVNRMQGMDDELKRNLFEQPIMEAWGVLLGETRRHLDALWADRVVSFYRGRIEGKFPFEGSTSGEVDLADLTEFFHPVEGRLAQFRNEELQRYLNNSWRGRRVGISSATVRALEKAEEIAQHLFEGDEVSVSFQLEPEQTDRLNLSAPRPNYVNIFVHDQNNYRYDQGGVRPWHPFRWPGFPQEARITVGTQQGNYSEGDIGQWAWFRLLAKAQVNPQGPGQFRVSWVLGSNEYLVKYNLQYGNKADLFRDVLRFFDYSCPNSLF